MIDWIKSAELNKCTVEWFKGWLERYPGSGKRIIAICDTCGKIREVYFFSYATLCVSCSQKIAQLGRRHTDESKKKMSDAQIGKVVSDETRKRQSIAFTGRVVSDESRKKMSIARRGRVVSDETKKKMSIAMCGLKRSHAARINMSCGQRRILREDWDGFITDVPYCDKFDDECREKNRDKYRRKCFICGKSEIENGYTNRSRKLSVHHVDLNKQQGCDNHDWLLIPVCAKCHRMSHTEIWKSRIVWLLNNVYI